jgi:hypothetical protein
MKLSDKIKKHLNRSKRQVEEDVTIACALLEQTPYPNTALIAKARLMKSEYFLGFIESGLEKYLQQEEERIVQEETTAIQNAEILALQKEQKKSLEVQVKEVIQVAIDSNQVVPMPKKIIPVGNQEEFNKQVALKNSLITARNLELNKLADFAESDNAGRKAVLDEVTFINEKITEVSKRLDMLEAGTPAVELVVTANPDLTQQINNLRSQITKTNASIKAARSPAKKKRYEDKLAKLTTTLNELYEIKADRQ